MLIRDATYDDWPAIWPIFSEVVRAEETYAFDPDLPEGVVLDGEGSVCEVTNAAPAQYFIDVTITGRAAAFAALSTRR